MARNYSQKPGSYENNSKGNPGRYKRLRNWADII